MKEFEVLCVTMRQTDFSKIREMNIHSDVVFANQAEGANFEQIQFEGHTATMVTTNTRGVGINRNIALMYADSDICLLADDDIIYTNEYVDTILAAFKKIPQADVIVFNIFSRSTEIKRFPSQIHSIKRLRHFSRKPFGGPRVAFRLNSVKKANIWFTSLFGGGCIYASGEDSMWIYDALQKGLKVYCYPATIGSVTYKNTSWFTGYNESFFYDKGAFYKAAHQRTWLLWMLYFVWRTRKENELSIGGKLKCMCKGSWSYQNIFSYDEFSEKREELSD